MSVGDDPHIVRSVMDDLRSTPISGRGDFADKRAVTQVEKWMAIIREISQQRLSSDLLTSAEIDERTDERTTLMVSMADKIIEANRTQRESLRQTRSGASQRNLEAKETADEAV